MDFKYIDIHSHLNLEQFDSDRDAVVANMKEKNIASITVGVDESTSRKAIALAEAYDNLYVCVGIHPIDTKDAAFNTDAMRDMALHAKTVAIGECGVDYFRSKTMEDSVRQKDLFIRHADLAREVKKPLMIHARPSKGSMDAYEDVLDILKEYSDVHAHFHFFVGDIAIAEEIVKRGYTVSFDGPITFTNDYDEVIRFLPIENIMVETDAPFAAPVPYRGKRCEPPMVEEIARKIALIKDIDESEAISALRLNTHRIFTI